MAARRPPASKQSVELTDVFSVGVPCLLNTAREYQGMARVSSGKICSRSLKPELKVSQSSAKRSQALLHGPAYHPNTGEYMEADDLVTLKGLVILWSRVPYLGDI